MVFWGGKERETEEWRRVELSEGNREVREGERERGMEEGRVE